VIELLHQGKQPADLAARKTFAGEPVQVVPRQIGDEAALVLPIRHRTADEQFQVFRIHARIIAAMAFDGRLAG
jgi:hypothetical protein